MNEKLLKYRESLKIVDEMEDELYKMVDFLFKNVTINSKFVSNTTKYFEKLDYNGDGETSKLRVSYWSCGEEENEDYEVPNTIIEKYFEGKKDEAKEEFVQFLKDDAISRENAYNAMIQEQQEKAKIREQELAKQKEIDERNLYEKLKQKYGEN
jgi:hypothetical protein